MSLKLFAVLTKNRHRERSDREYQRSETEIEICAGLVLSQGLCIWQNMDGNLKGNFHFTNHGLILQLLQINRSCEVKLIQCEQDISQDKCYPL